MLLSKEELQALFSMKCVYAPGNYHKEQIQKAISGKFVVAERQRPNIVQIAHSFRDVALEEK